MNKKIIGVLIVVVMGLIAISSTILQMAAIICNFIFEMVGLDIPGITPLVIMISFGIFAYLLLKDRKTLGQIFSAGLFAAINGIFLVFYYGTLFDFIILKTGVNPKVILFWQTLLLVIIIGIMWFLAACVIDIKSEAGKGYALISFFGPILIALSLYTQPYDLFEHDTKIPFSVEADSKKDGMVKITWDKKKKSKYEEYLVSELGEYVVLSHKKDKMKVYLMKDNELIKPKFWILKDAEGEIIDHAYSPGVSSRYGKKLIPGTPEDVEAVEIFLEKNSKIPFIYKKQESAEDLDATQDKSQFTIKTFTLGPFTRADTNNETGYITVYEGGDKNVKVGDKIEVIATLEDGSPYMGGGVKVAGKTNWIPLVNGYDQSWVGSIGSGFHVYIAKTENVKFIVKITGKREKEKV